MKRILSLIMIAALVFSMTAVFSVSAEEGATEETVLENVLTEDNLVDIDAITESTAGVVSHFDEAGYTGNVMKFMMYGDTVYLGEIDLSKYSSVDFIYGCDMAAIFNGNKPGYICLTKNGPVQENSEKGSAIDGAEIIATAELMDGDGAPWASSEKYAFVDLETDYCGPVYLTMNIGRAKGTDAEGKSVIRKDGIVISEVAFIEKDDEGSSSTENETEAPATDNTAATATPVVTVAPTVAPTTAPTEAPVEDSGCGSIVGGAGVMAVIAAAFVFLKKRG